MIIIYIYIYKYIYINDRCRLLTPEKFKKGDVIDKSKGKEKGKNKSRGGEVGNEQMVRDRSHSIPTNSPSISFFFFFLVVTYFSTWTWLLCSLPYREKVFADIEVLYSQLARLKPSSDLASSDFKAKPNSLAYAFSGMSVASDESIWETRITVSSNRCEITII